MKLSLKRKNERLGQYLYQARLARKITQKQAATLFGHKTAQYISNIERGQCAIPAKIFIGLIQLYKLNPREVIEKILESERVRIEAEILGPLRRKK